MKPGLRCPEEGAPSGGRGVAPGACHHPSRVEAAMPQARPHAPAADTSTPTSCQSSAAQKRRVSTIPVRTSAAVSIRISFTSVCLACFCLGIMSSLEIREQIARSALTKIDVNPTQILSSTHMGIAGSRALNHPRHVSFRVCWNRPLIEWIVWFSSPKGRLRETCKDWLQAVAYRSRDHRHHPSQGPSWRLQG